MTRAGLLLPFWWDTQKLRALPIAEAEMPMTSLDWHLSWRCWALDSEPFKLTPLDVLHDPDRYREQAERIAHADLRFPIDIIHWQGRWTIMDGIHRLARAVSTGRLMISARQVSPDDLHHITSETPAGGAVLETLTHELASATA